MDLTTLLEETEEKFVMWSARLLGSQFLLFVELGMEMLNGLRGRAYNHSRTARNVGILFTNILGPIVWKSKFMV